MRISRRTALMGGAAAVATVATTAPLAIQAVDVRAALGDPDARLEALQAQYWQVFRAEMKAQEREEVAFRGAREDDPEAFEIKHGSQIQRIHSDSYEEILRDAQVFYAAPAQVAEHPRTVADHLAAYGERIHTALARHRWPTIGRMVGTRTGGRS